MVTTYETISDAAPATADELRREGVSQAFAEPGTGGVDDADLTP